jgi:hypothetical protein
MTSEFEGMPLAVTVGFPSVCSGTALYEVSRTVRVTSDLSGATRLEEGSSPELVDVCAMVLASAIGANKLTGKNKRPTRAITIFDIERGGMNQPHRPILARMTPFVNQK